MLVPGSEVVEMFYAVDSDVRPVLLTPVTGVAGKALVDSGDARELLPTSRYALTWATRHGETRWFLFPKVVR